MMKNLNQSIFQTILARMFANYRMWAWGAIIASITVCGSISWLHYHQQHVLKQVTAELTTIRQARVDLAKGFLIISLSGDPTSPFDREQGLALLNQAVISLDSALSTARIHPAQSESLDTFRSSIHAFQDRLSEWRNAPLRLPKMETDLRSALYDLERQADRIDAHVQHELRQRYSRLDFNFSLVLGCAALLLAGFCSAIYSVGRTREKTETALWESELHFRSYFMRAMVGMAATSTGKGWLEVNPALCAILGYSAEELSRMTWAEMTHPDDLAADASQFEQLLAGELDGYSIEKRFIRKDGAFIWTVTAVQCVRNPDRSAIYFVAIIQNINDRKLNEEILKHSQEKYRFLFQNNPLPMWIYDLETLAFLAVNNAATDHYGYTQEEFLNMTLKDIRPADEVQKLLESVREKGQNIRKSGIWRHRKKNGALIDVNITTHDLDFEERHARLVLAHDITDQKTAEEALRKSEERLRLALYAANQGLYDLDIQTGDAVVSPEYATMLGYDPEEFRETNARWIERLHPDDHERVVNTFGAYVRGELPIYSVECRQRTRSGDWKWILSLGKIIVRDTAGNPLRMLGTHTDITDRKRAEEEQAMLASQLLQAQKMESIGRLAGGVAHDFNNMLTVILGYAELIKDQLSAHDPILKSVLEIERAASLSRDTTRQLLAFSRKQIISPMPTNLNELVAGARQTLSRIIGEDIDLRFLAGDEIWKVRCDASQIEQIIINLAVNARDAMPDGGKLTIETANITFDEAYCREHLGFSPGRFVQLMVSDDGDGMDPETMSHIFEPFFTTKEMGKGTGLGLATIYGIVQQNNGFINVYSEPGQGTTFRIYFPRDAGEAEMRTRAVETPVISGSGTVLLVEDDEMVRDLAKAMLEKIGYKVQVAKTPLDALSLCERKEVPIDLMLSDVVMPGMKGPELRDRIAAIRPGIKVLFMSGYTSNVIVHHGVLDEGVDFIQKPFSLNDLSRKICRVLERDSPVARLPEKTVVYKDEKR